MGRIKVRGLRSVALFGGLATFTGATIYAVIVYPYLHINEYKEVQKVTRAGIDQEAVQPGGMKVWSDPFKSKT